MNDTNFTNNLLNINVDIPESFSLKGRLQTLSNAWYCLAGGRLALAAEKKKLRYAKELEEYKKSLEEGVQKIPEEKLIEPPLQVAEQALEDSKYCIESETLRKMFASLITNSMNIDYAQKLHPSFSKIIQQMSPLDAQMLKLFRDQQHNGGIAVVNYREKLKNGGFIPLDDYIPAQFPADSTPELASRSLFSLQRLGLIQIPADGYFTEESRYAIFQRTALYQRLNHKASISGCTLDMEKHLAKLTAFGCDFADVCCG